MDAGTLLRVDRRDSPPVSKALGAVRRVLNRICVRHALHDRAYVGLAGDGAGISRGQVALEKIEGLGLALDEGNREGGAGRPVPTGARNV